MSLLAGMEAAVCGVLCIPHLRHRSALLELGGRECLPVGSVAALHTAIANNWTACRGAGGSASRENWRWRVPQLAISAHNASPEVVLERALMAAVERAARTDWSNQVPVASGVAGPTAERRRAIDLVRQTATDGFEFVELKVGSDTPLYAAIEIIAYVCIWLVSRELAPLNPSALLAATRIDARVLAPRSYYARYRLDRLERQFEQEVRQLGELHGVGLSFAFQAFPDERLEQPYSDDQLLALLDGRERL
ncbi:MAG: hypothetical protein JWM33_883 [Caulobacteraceae bacterium]|nr:hypothetical protein [Caulobacteraceae bacterium]